MISLMEAKKHGLKSILEALNELLDNDTPISRVEITVSDEVVHCMYTHRTGGCNYVTKTIAQFLPQNVE